MQSHRDSKTQVGPTSPLDGLTSLALIAAYELLVPLGWDFLDHINTPGVRNCLEEVYETLTYLLARGYPRSPSEILGKATWSRTVENDRSFPE
ncbi:hypothetical protein KPH14_005402 [Odynerus spinipes]|uniref:Uncharacterized protein n=1 Tax=Odynerus spinipes TaxID=1348599 RepID=A0AAD9VK65_9HYME|nr:hypothetical protein KPH14_005402 [Odynerus spinipes]